MNLLTAGGYAILTVDATVVTSGPQCRNMKIPHDDSPHLCLICIAVQVCFMYCVHLYLVCFDVQVVCVEYVLVLVALMPLM